MRRRGVRSWWGLFAWVQAVALFGASALASADLPCADALASALESGTVLFSYRIGSGATRPRIGYVLNGLSLQRALIKEKDPTPSPLSDPEAEVAAYVLSRALGLHRVPITVLRERRGRLTSFQQFIPGAQSPLQAGKGMAEDPLRQLFDAFIDNYDRNDGNVLLAKGKTYWIDHSFAFNARGLRTELLPDPEVLGEDGERFLAALEGLTPDEIIRLVRPLLGDERTTALLVRRRQLLDWLNGGI